MLYAYIECISRNKEKQMTHEAIRLEMVAGLGKLYRPSRKRLYPCVYKAILALMSERVPENQARYIVECWRKDIKIARKGELARNIMRRASSISSPVQRRLYRGKLDKLTSHLSASLRDSVLREYDRLCPANKWR